MDSLLKKLNIKRGSVYAPSIAKQSYMYRLCHIWINVLLMEDKRGTSLNPLKISLADIIWIAYYLALVIPYILLSVFYAPIKAYKMKDVTPIDFGRGDLTINYYHSYKWYYDNGSVVSKDKAP